MWLWNVLHLNLGNSTICRDPVWDVIKSRFPISLTIGLTGFFLSYFVCIPLGVMKAVRHGTKFDLVSSFIVFLGYSVPGWALGTALLVLFGGGSFWSVFPLGGFRPDNWNYLNVGQKVYQQARYMFLPVLCYMVGEFATLTILTKNSLMENMAQDYIRTAFAKGLHQIEVIFVHALRNSLIPLATGLGSVFSLILAGSFLIENVFNIDGMGYLGYTAILQRDYPVALGILVIGSLLMLVGNIISDIIYALGRPADPLQMTPRRSESLFRKRLRKFRRLKRGYYSFVIVVSAYILSFFLPFIMTSQPLVVKYHGSYYFPMLHFHSAAEFGTTAFGEPDYRELKKTFAAAGQGDWVLTAPYPYGPNESLLDLSDSPPNPPSRQHPLGTDDRGRDVLVRLAYGFNISMTFALLVTIFSESTGTMVGSALGYFGGKLDILGSRFIEIWSSLPFLYTIIIISSVIIPVYVPGRMQVLQPSFWLLVIILAIFDWVGITFYLRGASSIGKRPRTTSAPRSPRECRSRRSCSSTSCRTP